MRPTCPRCSGSSKLASAGAHDGGHRSAATPLRIAALGGLVGTGVGAAPLAEDIRDIRGPKYLLPDWVLPALIAGALLLGLVAVRTVALAAQAASARIASLRTSPAAARRDSLAHAAGPSTRILHRDIRCHSQLHRAEIPRNGDPPNHGGVSARPTAGRPMPRLRSIRACWANSCINATSSNSRRWR